MGKKYFLSVLGIFKNESDIFEEWIQHYLKEGVDHFYLIDNNSNDNFMHIIKKYNDKITFYSKPEKNKQLDHYRSVIPDIKKESEWLLICDFDEFVFSKSNYTKIPDVIKKFRKEKDVTQIFLPWKNFSSNKQIEQPESVIKGFNDRKYYRKLEHRSKKYIILVDSLEKVNIHECKMKNGISVDSKNEKPNLCGERLYIDEDELSRYEIHLNHYPIQSYNWFMSVKATRGDVAWQKKDKIRDKKYFDEFDKNSGYLDNLLVNKKY